MKNLRLILIVVILLITGSYVQQLSAQQKTKAEQEKELEILKKIDEQKKAISEQKKAQYKAEIELSDQDALIDDVMRDVRIKVESVGSADEGVSIWRPRPGRSYSNQESFIVSPGLESFYDHSFGGDSERTTWEFSKSVKENSFSSNYAFDVEKTANTVVMSIMGDCKAGDIRIKIVMPNGKNYSDILIDEFGNLNWRKSFKISETENQDKTGEWKFQIASNKATGYFKISLQTY